MRDLTLSAAVHGRLEGNFWRAAAVSYPVPFRQEEIMAKMTWYAYYFDSFDNTAPPVRTVTIQAESEEDAGRIATQSMGRCLRVDVTRPLWEAPNQTIPASDSASEG